MNYKSFVQTGTITSWAGGTTVGWPSLAFNTSEFSAMDVLINVATLTGSPYSFSVQEIFSDAGYLETANTGSITTAGVYWLTHGFGIAGSIPTNIKQTSPLLGKGREKKVVFNVNNNGTISASVYMLPYNE